MTWTISTLIACVLAFFMGYSVNQGGTCLVATAHELHHRRRPRLFIGLLGASAAAGLVAVPLAWSGAAGGALAASAELYSWVQSLSALAHSSTTPAYWGLSAVLDMEK